MHTPGPWWVDDDFCVAVGGNDRYRTLAETFPNAEDGEGEMVGDANARLMAAAPALLEAAQNTLEQLEEWEELNQPDDGPEWEHITMLKAAINKAKGEN